MTRGERRIGQHAPEDVLGLGGATRHALEDAVEQLGVYASRPARRRNQRQPPCDGRRLTPFVHVAAAGEDQIECAVPSLRTEEALDRGGRVTVGQVPPGCRGEQLGLCFGVRGAQPVTQQIPEQMVEAVVVGLTGDGDDEHRLVLEAPEEAGPFVDAADHLDQPRADLVEDRQLQQRSPSPLGLRIEDLLAEIVDRQPITLGERLDEFAGIGAEAQAEGGELDAGSPPLGALDDRGDGRSVDGAPQDPLQHCPPLSRSKASSAWRSSTSPCCSR